MITYLISMQTLSFFLSKKYKHKPIKFIKEKKLYTYLGYYSLNKTKFQNINNMIKIEIRNKKKGRRIGRQLDIGSNV